MDLNQKIIAALLAGFFLIALLRVFQRTRPCDLPSPELAGRATSPCPVTPAAKRRLELTWSIRLGANHSVN